MPKQKSKILASLFRASLIAMLFVGIAASFIFTFSRPEKANAVTSSTLNFQARLLNSSGSLVADGNYNVEFKIYNASSSSGSSQGSCSGDVACLWTETRTSTDKVRVVNGYLTVNLGSVTAFSSTINWDQEMWLTMNIGGTGTPGWDGEMTPRLKLTAVPYAFRAGQLANLNGANLSTLGWATQSTSNSILLPNEGGTICIQTSTSCGFAASSGSANYIQNGTSTQTANFNIQSAAAGSTAALIQGAASATVAVQILKGGATPGATADLLQLQNSSSNVLAKFDRNGQLTLGRIAASGTVQAGTITLADGSNDNFGVTLGTLTLTTNRAINLPDEAGTICLRNSTNCGFATSAGSGVTTVGAFSASAQANGATIAGSTITFGPADASTPGMISTAAQTIAGAKTFNASLNVASGQAYQINSSNVLSASSLSFTAAGTADIQPAATRALTITAHAASTWSTDSGLLTLQGNGGVTVTAVGTTAVTVDSAGAGSVLLGNANATTVTLGNTGSTTTSIQGNTAINVGTSSTGGTITLGGTANTGQISIGNASNTSAQTITIGTGGTGVKTITLGGTAANVIAIGNSQTGGSIALGGAMTSGTVTIGSSGTSGATTLQSGSGNVNILTNSASAKVVIKSGVNDDTAFQVQDSGNNPVLNVDTSNTRVGIGTAAPSRTLHAYVSNTQTTAPMALLEQASTGDATLEFKTPSLGFIAGLDASDSSKFKISSSTASASPIKLGYTFIGGTTDVGNPGIIACNKHTASTSGSIVSISVYVGAVDNTPNNQFQVGIYTDSGGSPSNPSTLVANSASGTLTANSLNTASISATFSSGTTYWLCYETNGSASTFNNMKYNTGASNTAAWKAGTSMGTWSSSFGTPTGLYDANYSMYATYAAGAYDSFNVALFSLTDTGQAVFQNSANTSTAFQVQNAAGNSLLTVDSSSSQVIFGKASSVTGKMLFQNGTNANTITIQSGTTSSSYTLTLPTALSGGAGDCLKDTTGAGVLGFAACGGSGSTLQAAYDSGNTITTTNSRDLTVTLADTTVDSKFAVNMQCTTCSASGGRFEVQNGGTAVFWLNPGTAAGQRGTAVFKNSANDVSAFQVQNASAVSMLNVDNSSSQVEVGSATTDATAIDLVLDSYNGASDPTGVAGAMYYSTNSNTFRCYQAGVWQDCIGSLKRIASVVSNTLTATTQAAFTYSGFTPSIPANYCIAGRAIRIAVTGQTDNSSSSTRTLALTVRIGTTVVSSTATTPTVGIGATGYWMLEYTLTCRSAPSTTATIAGQGWEAASTALNVLNPPASMPTIDTTTAQTINIYGNVSGNLCSANINQFIVEGL